MCEEGADSGHPSPFHPSPLQRAGWNAKEEGALHPDTEAAQEAKQRVAAPAVAPAMS